jgi:hypothetical protein
MGEYSGTIPVLSVQITRAQGSSIVELERNMNAALSAIAANRVVTAIRVAGSGQGHMFTVEIEHGVGQGYDPDDLELRCYMATGVRELGVQYAAAIARSTAGTVKLETISMGASDDLVSGGLLVYVDPDSVQPTNLWLAQTTWYINGGTSYGPTITHGDDNLDGATLDTAIQSHAEFARRMGTNPTITDYYLVYFYGSTVTGTTAFPIDMEATFSGPGAAIHYKGMITGGASRLVGTWVDHDYDPANYGTAGYFTDSLGAAFPGGTAFAVIFNGGTANEAVAIRSLLYNGDLNCRCNVPMRLRTPAAGQGKRFVQSITVNPGDSYQVATLPAVMGGMHLVAHRNDTGGSGAPEEVATFIVERLGFPASGVSSRIPQLMASSDDEMTNQPSWGSSPLFLSCAIDCPVVSSVMWLAGCSFVSSSNGTRTQTGFTECAVAFSSHSGGGARFYSCVVNGERQVGVSFPESYFDSAIGTAVLEFRAGTIVGVEPMLCGVYPDGDRPGVLVECGSSVAFNEVWGPHDNGGASDAEALIVNGTMYYRSAVLPRIEKGALAVTDCLIGGTAVDYAAGANNLPWANVVTNGVGGNTAMVIERPE